MQEQNRLLRSALAVAKRKGVDTNWEALAINIERELCRQVMVDKEDEQQVLRATCTPKTYKIYSETTNMSPPDDKSIYRVTDR